MADDPVDELYGLPPADFVAQRDALARRLRQDGDRERAVAVKALGRPTRAAWAVNRLVRDRPEEIGALLEAGEALAAAQEQLLDGADAGVLRAAAEASRRLVDALAQEAEADGATRDRVRATLHAATVDPAVRAEVAAGRLTKERSASGFGPEAPGDRRRSGARGAGRRAATGRKGAAGGGRGAAAARNGKDKDNGAAASAKAATREPPAPRPDPRVARRRRDALRRAKEAEATAQGAVAGAQRALEQVEATVQERRRDLERAEAALSAARARRERAEQAADG
ncbi:hypothetical protein FSW04_08450 [Baekduia soli]|uniref:Uncharacterized protein n=1 Tax=Baekduia soli TaxID=496014 RepID=A0A5B8U4M3_9ACTN|nr:hypothetical protein [Baekduia soli]QEC47602.1 hypothetical protein FSW04_08450 [Baekduia soli]